ncbi:MAG: glycosyltransferase family 4 protein, partial [Actinobacteria bacterium]|nr:glycosyltransferase family 4 protein [Actinomycetota bacterium]
RAEVDLVLPRRLQAERWVRCRTTRRARIIRGVGRTVRVRTATLRVPTATFRVRFALATMERKLRLSLVAVGRVARGTPWLEAALGVLPRRLAFLARTEREHALVAEAMRVAQALRAWQQLCPDREPLTPEDYQAYTGHLAGWRALMDHYDVVQAYSVDPIIPLLAGFERYAAYEHGTLREIPFEDSPRGRTCALSYCLAPRIFVTNLDVLPSVDRLGIEPERVVCLPHAVDSGRLMRFARDNPSLVPPASGPPVVFSPTRQDWIEEDGNWSKGNDRLLHAARALLDEGHEFQLVLVAWGRDLDASRDLVADLGLGVAVEWIEPLRKRELWARYLTSHAVVDQFVLGAIGGVAFEALAFGRRIVTALDVPAATRFFGEPPPVLAASTAAEAADGLRRVLADPADAAGLGAAGSAWFRRYHSSERIMELQLRAYAALVPGLHPAGAARGDGHTS